MNRSFSFLVAVLGSSALFAEEPAEPPVHPLIDEALQSLRKECGAPALKVEVRWAELEKGYVEDENLPFNASVVDMQGRQILLAIADGCRAGMTVVDKVIEQKMDKISTRFERPTRKVPLEKLRALDKIALTLNGNDAAFRSWLAENFGKPPIDPYTQIFKSRYDAAVFKEDIDSLHRRPSTLLPPQMARTGKTLAIGLGSTVEIDALWFNRVLDMALSAPQQGTAPPAK